MQPTLEKPKIEKFINEKKLTGEELITAEMMFYAEQLKEQLGEQYWMIHPTFFDVAQSKEIKLKSPEEKFQKKFQDKRKELSSFSENPDVRYNFAQTFLEHEKVSQTLKEHFADQNILPKKKLPKISVIKEGESPGYVATSVSKPSQKFMIKEAQRAGAQRDAYTKDFVNEFIMGDIYRFLLTGKAPIIAGVMGRIPEYSYFRSEYLPGNFKTLSQFTGSADDPTRLGSDIKKLKGIEGIEKVFAAGLLLAEFDMHAGNIGVMDIDGKKVLAKIDHGRSATLFFTNPASVLNRFADDYDFEKFGYRLRLPLRAGKLKEALTEMIILLSDEQIEKFVKAKMFKLKEMKFAVKDLEFSIRWDEVDEAYNQRKRTYKAKDFSRLENFYISKLIRQREILKQVCDRLGIIAKIELPETPAKIEAWVNGEWLANIKGEDPIAWAVKKGKKIEKIDPIVWAIEHGKKIEGQSPIKWTKSNNYKKINGMDINLWEKQHVIDLERYELLTKKDFSGLLRSYGYSESETVSLKKKVKAIRKWSEQLESAGDVNLALWGSGVREEIAKLKACINKLEEAKKITLLRLVIMIINVFSFGKFFKKQIDKYNSVSMEATKALMKQATSIMQPLPLPEAESSIEYMRVKDAGTGKVGWQPKSLDSQKVLPPLPARTGAAKK